MSKDLVGIAIGAIGGAVIGYFVGKKQGSKESDKGFDVPLVPFFKKIGRGITSKNNRTNAPTFAYQAVYGELPDAPLRGRTDSKKKTWNGVPGIDVNIKDKWLNEINGINGIEIRSTDEGKSDKRVAFVIFRMADPDNDGRAAEISKKLNQMENIHSDYNIGNQGRPRIVAAGKVKYGDYGWEEWWNTIGGKIRRAVS